MPTCFWLKGSAGGQQVQGLWGRHALGVQPELSRKIQENFLTAVDWY